MKFLSLEDIQEGDMMPDALISASFVKCPTPSIDEQSLIFKIALPIGYGEVYRFDMKASESGFRWLNLGVRFTDIVHYSKHIKEISFFKYLLIERPDGPKRTR